MAWFYGFLIVVGSVGILFFVKKVLYPLWFKETIVDSAVKLARKNKV